MNNKYSPEEIKDIQIREKEALDTLKRLQFTPSALLNSINLGNDVFATKVTPYLQDLKFTKPQDVAPVAPVPSSEDNAKITDAEIIADAVV